MTKTLAYVALAALLAGCTVGPPYERPAAEMPAAWTKTFGIVFSNSFDQSQDPYRTAMEWKRVLRPGGYLIFCFAEGVEPTTSDPVGDLRLEDARRLFGGELLHFGDHGSRAGYSEVVLRLDRA